MLPRSLGCCRASIGCGLNLSGHPHGKVLKLLDQYSTTAEITLHGCGLKEQPECSSKPNPVESRNNPCYVLTKLAKKAFRNAVGRWQLLSFHTPLLPRPTALYDGLVAAPPRCVLLRLFRLYLSVLALGSFRNGESHYL